MVNNAYLSSAEIIIFLSNMTFPPPDPQRFLLESIPDRFGKLSAQEFCDFIRYLFQLDGYEVQVTVMSANIGPHFRAKKDDHYLVILPVIGQGEVALGKDDIQRALKAKELYQSSQAWLITTTTFNPEAKSFADHHDIELWDWNTLYEGICQLFFEGKSHLEYAPVKTVVVEEHDEKSQLKLKVKWEAKEGVEKDWYNLGIRISNPTQQNLYIHLELPALIDSEKTQHIADQWGTDDFVSGMIYAGATVRTNARFKASKVGDRPPGGRIVLTYHERKDNLITFHLTAQLRGEACYFVTYCFGRDSEEYRSMTRFRDERLQRHMLGQIMISFYYRFSPLVVALARRSTIVDCALRQFTKVVLRLLRHKLSTF